MAGRKAFKFTKAHLAKVEEAAREGYTRKDCAKLLKISYSTFLRNFDYFEQSYKKGLEDCDKFRIQVAENSLFKRVTGYEYEEHTYEPPAIKTRNTPDLVITKTVRKQMAPDVTAAIFYLVNRNPERWRSINKDHDDRNQNYTGNFQFHVIEAADDNGES